MSAGILDRVWKAAPAGLTPFQHLVLIRLAWYVDDDATNCFASVPTIAKETASTDRGVRGALGELRRQGLIVVAVGAGPRGTNRVSLQMAQIESGLPLNCGAGLNREAGLNDSSGLPLNCGSATPEREGISPLNGGSANKHERQDRQKKDTSRAKRELTDPRHRNFRTAFETYYQHVNMHPAPWDGRQAKALSAFLAANPTWTLADWQGMLQNRRRSDVAQGEALSQWIAHAPTLATSPVDRYGKPKSGPVGVVRPIYGNPNWRTEHA